MPDALSTEFFQIAKATIETCLEGIIPFDHSIKELIANHGWIQSDPEFMNDEFGRPAIIEKNSVRFEAVYQTSHLFRSHPVRCISLDQFYFFYMYPRFRLILKGGTTNDVQENYAKYVSDANVWQGLCSQPETGLTARASGLQSISSFHPISGAQSFLNLQARYIRGHFEKCFVVVYLRRDHVEIGVLQAEAPETGWNPEFGNAWKCFTQNSMFILPMLGDD
jgi:hypothetical protein